MARNLGTFLLLAVCALAPLVTSTTNIFGQFDKSVTLKCPLKPSSNVEWYDWVYNLNADTPAMIYKNGRTTDDEYHGGRFSVDPSTGHLTISGLNEDDVGIYFCETSETDRHEFNLILAELPECQGQVTGLHENDQTNLQCNMKYSGNQAPKLEWLREDEVLSNAEDKNQIGMATQTVDIKVTADMDKNTFICRAVLGEMVEDCTLHFEVKYQVRDPTIEPEKKSYTPGSTLSCVAKGNPEPDVKVTLPDGEVIRGKGKVNVVVPDEWEATTKFIHCQASNEVDGVPASKSLNYTFTVSSPTEPVEGGNQDAEAENAGTTQLAGIVAGIVIGAIVLVIIIVAVVCIKRRQSKPPKGSKPVPTKEDGLRDETKA